MFNPRDSADSADKFPPALALLRKSFLTLRRQTVVTPPSLIGLFDPATMNQAALFEAVEQGIQRSDVEAQAAPGTGFDELPDVVTVARLVLEQRERISNSALPFFHSWSMVMPIYVTPTYHYA